MRLNTAAEAVESLTQEQVSEAHERFQKSVSDFINKLPLNGVSDHIVLTGALITTKSVIESLLTDMEPKVDALPEHLRQSGEAALQSTRGALESINRTVDLTKNFVITSAKLKYMRDEGWCE